MGATGAGGGGSGVSGGGGGGGRGGSLAPADGATMRVRTDDEGLPSLVVASTPSAFEGDADLHDLLQQRWQDANRDVLGD